MGSVGKNDMANPCVLQRHQYCPRCTSCTENHSPLRHLPVQLGHKVLPEPESISVLGMDPAIAENQRVRRPNAPRCVVHLIGNGEGDFFVGYSGINALKTLINQLSNISFEAVRVQIHGLISPGDTRRFQPVTVDRWRLRMTDGVAHNGGFQRSASHDQLSNARWSRKWDRRPVRSMPRMVKKSPSTDSNNCAPSPSSWYPPTDHRTSSPKVSR